MHQKAHQTATLRDEMAELGEMLGHTIQQLAGDASLHVVESIRRLSRDRRNGDRDAGQQLRKVLASLSEDDLRVVIRAFTVFLDLANLAEDRQRVRVLRDRTLAAYPNPRSEAIEDALLQLKAAGKSADDVQRFLDQLRIELVFTAHPTEAKRRSMRGKLRQLRELMDKPNGEQTPAECDRTRRLVRAQLAKLWLTDFIRPWRPTVLQEVQRGLSMKPVLWEVVPEILSEMRGALSRVFPETSFQVGPCVTFGTWIGGDRDGHPYVTADVTEQTIVWLRQAALEFHLAACRDLFDSLSLSQRQTLVPDEVNRDLAGAIARWPPLKSELAEIPPNEMFRRWLAVIGWRLRQTQTVSLDDLLVDGAYSSPCDLDGDVSKLRDALIDTHGDELLADEVTVWLDRIRIFGFHLARLDVRQDSRHYAAVLNELLEDRGLCQSASALSEVERQELLAKTLTQPLGLHVESLSEEARETLSLFRLVRRIVTAFGPLALGGHVVSMTHARATFSRCFGSGNTRIRERKSLHPTRPHRYP